MSDVNMGNKTSSITDKNILITGGTGFAGSHLVEALLKNNKADDIHVTSFGGGENYLSKLLPNKNIHQADLTDTDQTTNIIKKVQPVQLYQLAAWAAVGNSFDNTQAVLENNLKLQLNILESLKNHSPHTRTLIIGSALEYETGKESILSETTALGPTNPYAVSKIMQDMLGYFFSKTHNLDIVRVRPFNHIGERQNPGFVVSDFAKQIALIEKGKQKEIKVGNLAAKRDFTDVKDITTAYILLMEKGITNEVYNVGSGKGYTIQEILDTMVSLSSADIKVSIDKNKFRPLDVMSVVADNSKITSLGWNPEHSLEETLKRVLDWWRENI